TKHTLPPLRNRKSSFQISNNPRPRKPTNNQLQKPPPCPLALLAQTIPRTKKQKEGLQLLPADSFFRGPLQTSRHRRQNRSPPQLRRPTPRRKRRQMQSPRLMNPLTQSKTWPRKNRPFSQASRQTTPLISIITISLC